jgi:hypothetical protein
MATERSYGKIVWLGNILSFQMVNSDSQQFTIYADPLINTFRNQGDFVRVKKRDGPGKRRVSYYPGEICGSIDHVKVEEERYFSLIIYIGLAEKTIKLSEDGTDLLNVIDRQTYLFPEDEFTSFMQAIEAMHDQNATFALLERGSEILKLDAVKIVSG